MKRITALIVLSVYAVTALTGCMIESGKGDNGMPSQATDGTDERIATIIYSFHDKVSAETAEELISVLYASGYTGKLESVFEIQGDASDTVHGKIYMEGASPFLVEFQKDAKGIAALYDTTRKEYIIRTDEADMSWAAEEIEAYKTVKEVKTKEDLPIRKQGQYANGLNDLNIAEQEYHLQKIFKAVKKLDVKTLKKYVTDEELLEQMAAIKENKKFRKLYKKIFGDAQIVFDESLFNEFGGFTLASVYIIGPSAKHATALWYEDKWRKMQSLDAYKIEEAESFSSAADMKEEEVDAFVKERLNDVRWVMTPWTWEFGAAGTDGKLDFSIAVRDIWKGLGFAGFGDMTPVKAEMFEDAPSFGYGSLVFAGGMLNDDYNYISEGIPHWETMLMFNVWNIADLMEREGWYKNSAPEEVEVWKSDAAKIVIQKFAEEHMEIGRTYSALLFFMDIDRDHYDELAAAGFDYPKLPDEVWKTIEKKRFSDLSIEMSEYWHEEAMPDFAIQLAKLYNAGYLQACMSDKEEKG